MTKIPIKPMSVNRAWKGRRFRTNEYKRYTRDVLTLLPALSVPVGDFAIVVEFGVSNWLADYDNPLKPFQDILQKAYQFDDSRITQAFISKTKVPKGQEYIWFQFANNLAVVAT